MPLTDYQARLGRLLAENRSEERYLVGGAAILAASNTRRYSQDLNCFHDSAARVASAYESDHMTLVGQGYDVGPDIFQPGYIRAIVRKGA